jgi:hypothetical protein
MSDIRDASGVRLWIFANSSEVFGLGGAGDSKISLGVK